MPRNGSGQFSPTNSSWSPGVNGILATASDWNALLADISAALTQSVSRDGQSPMLGNLNLANNKITNLAPGTGTGEALAFQQLFSQGTMADIASTATMDIGVQNTSFLRVTGTTTITSFGTSYRGPRFLTFAGAVTLTNSSTLVLPGGANITTAAGDSLIVIPGATLGTADKWVVMAYQKNAVPGTVDIPDGSITAAKLADTAAVKLTLDQTIAGVKTFSSSPVVPNATTPTQAVNKGQLDAAVQSVIARATSVAASGTSVDFTSIPSWVKRITVMFAIVSTSGTSLPVVRLGSSSGYATTGYVSAVGWGGALGQSSIETSGFVLMPSATQTAANFFSGSMVITNLASGTWVQQCGFYANSSAVQCNGGGGVNIGAVLDRIRITTVNGTDTFDLGSINILMEG